MATSKPDDKNEPARLPRSGHGAASLIPHLPEGLNELYCHPAAGDAEAIEGGVPGYKYREELEALLSPRVRAALADSGVTLVRFAGSLPKS